MGIDWAELSKVMYPIPTYEDMSKKWRDSIAYAFVRQAYNLSLPGLADYTARMLGEDARQRYTEWLVELTTAYAQLRQAGVKDVLDLLDKLDTREKYERFVAQNELDPKAPMRLLGFMVYWFIPARKYLQSLVKNDSAILGDIKTLTTCGIRFNLDLLESGRTPEGRRSLAQDSGLSEAAVTSLVNRADFSRMPWASSATVSNIIGAGYSSILKLANADPQKLYADFFSYGESIGKDLRLGIEIDSSYRIAKIIPKVVVE